MKLDPGFINHWKTENLIQRLGPEGVIVILRLWGNAQIRREWKGLNLTPKRIAMENKWKGDENHLWEVLTDPDAPWIDIEDGGTVAIHGFEDHQKQVIRLWEAGGKGGRPKKVSPEPSSKEDSSSSSYPICSTNGNHMVSKPVKTGKRFTPPTPQEAEDYAKSIGFDLDGEAFCAYYGKTGWNSKSGKISNWKSCVVTWKKTATKKGGNQSNTYANQKNREQLELP